MLTLLEGVVDVEKGQMVTINMCESHLGLIRLLLHLVWSYKALWD